MANHSSAVAAYREADQWHCAPLPPGVLEDLGLFMGALRSQPPEGVRSSRPTSTTSSS